MKAIKQRVSSFSGKSRLSAETKLCFGAAGGCAIIGAVGYAINVLTTMETTLSAFLVISAFYFMIGVISFFKSSPEYVYVQSTVVSSKASHLRNEKDELIESAA